MGQSSNEVLRYPSLIFSPPLESIITIAQPAYCSGKLRLRWQATLGRDDYDEMCSSEIEVQVWSNCTGERWSATPFRQRAALNPSIGDVEGRFDLALFECDAETIDDNQVTLEACISIPPSVGHTVEFTYRVVDAAGRTEWLGTNDTNGKIVVSGVEEDGCLKEEDWINEGDGMAFLPSVIREPMVIARLPSDTNTKWSGWAFKRDE